MENTQNSTKENLFRLVEPYEWNNWRWQVKHTIHDEETFLKVFPNIPAMEKNIIREYCRNFHFRITPYFLSLIELDEKGNPINTDPLWKQCCYCSLDKDRKFEYNGINQNWEKPEEIYYGILHHKYPGRVLIRILDSCFGNCNYCYVAHRTLDKRRKDGVQLSYHHVWDKIIQYLIDHPDVYEVLLSGGDPFLLNTEELAKVLESLRSLSSIKYLRINTRVLTYCPFRIDQELVQTLKKYSVNAIEVHFCHHRELTKEVDRALQLFEEASYSPLILWRAPLLKGINDSLEELEMLLLALYERKIIPYYLFHYAPYTLGRNSMGVSIKKGVKLLRALRRKIPGPAFPRYTLFHITGKQDIPLEINGTPEFQYQTDSEGRPIVRFLNWRGEWVTYPDIPEES